MAGGSIVQAKNSSVRSANTNSWTPASRTKPPPIHRIALIPQNSSRSRMRSPAAYAGRVPETTNADLARRGFEHWNERRIEPLLEFFHEDAVWDMRPFGVPDMAAFQGHDGLRRFFTEWLQAFPDSSIEVEGVEQRGDWTLTVVLQLVSGGSSGTPVPFRYGGRGALARRPPGLRGEPSRPGSRPPRFQRLRVRGSAHAGPHRRRLRAARPPPRVRLSSGAGRNCGRRERR